jgi:hypothetical protein
MRANFYQSLGSLLALLTRIGLCALSGVAFAADFTTPAPSLSIRPPFVLETALRTPSAELLFVRSQQFSSANGLVAIDSTTGSFQGAVKPWPEQYFGNVKILKTRDGGFVRATMQQVFGFQQNPVTVLQKFDAHGQWQACFHHWWPLQHIDQKCGYE